MAAKPYKVWAIPPEGKPRPLIDCSESVDIWWDEDNEGKCKYTGPLGSEYGVDKRWYRQTWDGRPNPIYEGIDETWTFELRRWLDKNWRKREAERLAFDEDGDIEYLLLPDEWDTLEIPKDHFTHVSTNGGDSRDYIAFTENEDKGMRDIQTRMRAGKYVKKFFPNLSNEQVRFYASAVQAMNAVHITDDPDEAAKVYENGPHSCMHKCFRWQSERTSWQDTPPRHPVAAYFNGDLKLAYMGTIDAPSARAIVWPAKKEYGRVYGAIDTLTQALENMGYTSVYGHGQLVFVGAKLKTIRKNEHNIVMPYLDGMAIEYYHEDGEIYSGNECRKGVPKRTAVTTGSETGLISFRDPTYTYCRITGVRLPKDAVIVITDRGETTTAEIAAQNRYVLSEEGWTNSPVYFCVEDTETIHSSRRWDSYESVHDVMETDRTVYRPRKDCIRINNYDGWTRRANKHKLIEYQGSYYSSTKVLFRYYPHLNPCVGYPEKPIHPELWKEIDRLSTAWLKTNGTAYSKSARTMEECLAIDPSFAKQLTEHFMRDAERNIAPLPYTVSRDELTQQAQGVFYNVTAI